MFVDFKKHDVKSEQVSILRMINHFEKLSRKQLVDLTGFSQAKISILVKELTNLGLVASIEGVESIGGRKAKLLQLNGKRGRLIGVELGGYEIKLTLIDLSGAIIAKDKRPTPKDVTVPQKVTEEFLAFIRDFISCHKVKQGMLKGIGIALSGIVNQDTKTCIYYRNQKSWENFPLMKKVEESFTVPCIMDDSSRMMAVAEKVYGGCREFDNFVLLNLGVGVGAGIFINGKLFRSIHGYGGEIGHMVIKENGPRCNCGNYGCLESFVSGNAIERQLKEALKNNVYTSLMGEREVGLWMVIDHAHNGDKLAYSLINDAAKHLGIGVANIINIFSPEAIVLAGGMSRAGEILLNTVEPAVRASALGSGRDTQIILSALDEYSGSLGAARYWLAEHLNEANVYDLLTR